MILASRALTGRNGGVPWTVLVVDGASDLPAVARCGLGDLAFGVTGDGDGKSWQVQKSSGGVAWVEITPGSGGGFTPPDDNVTNLGTSLRRFALLWLGTGITAASDLTFDLTGGLIRTLRVINSTAGQVADLFVDGTIRFMGGGAAQTSLAGAATTDRTATFPDADGVVVLANNSQTLSAKTFSRCRADPLTVSQISAIVGMIAPELAYASDGRKPGEGGGSGTGVYAYYDGTAWRSMCDGAALAA